MKTEISTGLKAFTQLIQGGDFIVLDTETTGLYGEICQIAVVDSKGHALLDTIVRPPTQAISRDAAGVHGISNDLAQRVGLPWGRVRPELLTILSQHSNMIIYNAAFDLRMLHNTDRGAGLEPVRYTSRIEVWCAMLKYAEWFGEWNDYHNNYRWQKLTDATQQQGLKIQHAHTAIGDCLMTLAVCRKMSAVLS